MNILERALLWISYSSLIATIMAILVLVIKKLFKNYLNPRFQHALWFLVLIRLILPIGIVNPLDLVNSVTESYKNIINYQNSDLTHSKETKDNLKNDIKGYVTDDISSLNSSETNTEETYDENSLSNTLLKIKNLLYKFKEQEQGFIQNYIKIFLYVWIIGFTVILISVFFITIKFKKNTNHFYKVNDTHIEHILKISKDKLGLNKNISIYSNNEFKSPFIYGVLNPKIYIPKYVLDKATSQELLHIILHELAHYKRKDLISNLISIIAILFYWFNPVIWFAMKNMREDRELACDSYILEVIEEHESVEYGMTILNFSKDFLNSGYKNNLNLCFYESKTQIERRIMMIRNFKKGSYKLSVLSIALLTLSGSIAFAGDEGSIVNPTIGVSVNNKLEKGGGEDLKLYFDDSRLRFNTLDRASDFIDFKFKVPDYLPQETQLMSIVLRKDKGNMIEIRFAKEEFSIEERFNFLISKENLIERLKNTNGSSETSDITVDYKEEPFSISNIHGKNVTIKTSSTRKLESSEKTTENERIEKYFIWNEENIWYGIEYYGSNGINKNDIEKMVTSLKDPKNVSKNKYTSKRPDEINIYDKKDLIKAEELLGFEPKLSLNLAEGFVAKGASLHKDEYNDKIASQGSTGQLRMSTIYGSTAYVRDDGSSSTGIWFEQGKNTFIYDSIEERVKAGIDDSVKNKKGPLDTSHRVDRSRTTSLKINDIDVFTNTQVDTYDDIKETVIQTYYTWKQHDVVYRVIIDGEVDNHEAIIKTLMN